MSERSRGERPSSSGDFPDRSWREHARRRAAQGLALSPAERLRWLESTLAAMRRWLGRARKPPPPPACSGGQGIK